ncbi:MAG: peroxiredoxin [Halobacteriaceae archaeon]
MPLEPRDPAPTITAPNQDGKTVSPRYETVTVVYFYVEDHTPGCVTQAQQFCREWELYRTAGIELYGVSTDDVTTHREFANTNNIKYDILADPDGKICSAFEVDRDHADRPKRTTFVIDNGEIIRTYENVTPDGHARNLLLELHNDGVVKLDF